MCVMSHGKENIIPQDRRGARERQSTTNAEHHHAAVDDDRVGAQRAMEVKIAYLPDPVKVKSKPGYPPPAVRERLQKEGKYAFEQITTNELLSGALTSRGFTLLCLPGGFAPHYDDKLGDEVLIIRNFVEAGGGFVGCAGATMTRMGDELLPVEVMGMTTGARKGSCKLSVTADGEKVLGTSGDLTVRYNNSPLLAILSVGGDIAPHV